MLAAKRRPPSVSVDLGLAHEAPDEAARAADQSADDHRGHVVDLAPLPVLERDRVLARDVREDVADRRADRRQDDDELEGESMASPSSAPVGGH